MGGDCLVAVLYKANETDFNHLGLGPLNDAVSILVTEERNGLFELEMTYPTSGNKFNELKLDRLIKADAGHKLKNQRFKIIRITKPLDGMVTIYAEHISYLSQDLALKPIVNYSGNASSALNIWKNSIVVPNPFTTYSDIQTNSGGEWSIKDLDNARQSLGGSDGSILDSYGGEFEFDNYDIRLYANRGRKSDALIAYGRNLTELTQEETIDSTYTSVYPYATSNENDVETILTLPEFFVDSEYVGNYARRKILKVDFSQEKPTTVEELRTKAEAYIKANNVGIPKVNLKVKIIDLSRTLDYENLQLVEQLNLCDWVTIYFEKFDIRTNAKIVKIVWDDLLKQYDSLEIGEARASLSNSINAIVDGKLETVAQDLSIVQRAANGKNKVFRSITEPTSGMVKNDLWYKPVGSGEIELYNFDGAYWKLEKVSAGLLGGTLDAENGDVNLINVNVANIVGETSNFVRSAWNAINSQLDVNGTELSIANLTTGVKVVFKNGEIEFRQGNVSRHLRYNSEGLVSAPGSNNTGTDLNSSFILQGGGTGSHQYIQLSEGGTRNLQQRLEALDGDIRAKVSDDGEFQVLRYNDDTFGPARAGSFTTYHSSGNWLSLIGDRLEVPGDEKARSIYIKPNGIGIVSISDKDSINYYNIKASTFLNASSRDLKTNIVETKINALEILETLTVVDYDLKKDVLEGVVNPQTGFIAEDSPEISDAEGKSIDSYKLATLNTKAIQELNAENKSLKQELQQIKEHLGLA